MQPLCQKRLKFYRYLKKKPIKLKQEKKKIRHPINYEGQKAATCPATPRDGNNRP